MVNLVKFFKKLFGIKEKKGGLNKAFSVGEYIPMKGIWFRIERVEFDEIVLRPKTATSKRMKVIHDLRLKSA